MLFIIFSLFWVLFSPSFIEICVSYKLSSSFRIFFPDTPFTIFPMAIIDQNKYANFITWRKWLFLKYVEVKSILTEPLILVWSNKPRDTQFYSVTLGLETPYPFISIWVFYPLIDKEFLPWFHLKYLWFVYWGHKEYLVIIFNTNNFMIWKIDLFL